MAGQGLNPQGLGANESFGSVESTSIDTERLSTASRASDYVIYTLDDTNIVATGDHTEGTVAIAVDDFQSVVEDIVDSHMDSRGGRMHVNTGEYLTPSAIEIDRSHVALTGPAMGFWEQFNSGNPGTGDEGQGLAKLKMTATGPVDMLRLENDSETGTRPNAQTVSGLYLYGPGTGSGVNGLKIDAGDQPVIEKLLLHNFETGVDANTDAGHYYAVSVMDVGGLAWNIVGPQNELVNCSAYDIGGNGFKLDSECRMIGGAAGRCDTGVQITNQGVTVSGVDIYENRSDGVSVEAANCKVDVMTGGNSKGNTGDGLVASANDLTAMVSAEGNGGNGVNLTSNASGALVLGSAEGNDGHGVRVASDGCAISATVRGNDHGFQVEGSFNTIYGTSDFNNAGIRFAGPDNVAYINFGDSNTTRVENVANRNVLNGRSVNNGDPSSTGAWNGFADRAHDLNVTVWDTSVSPNDPYIADTAGNWVKIGS